MTKVTTGLMLAVSLGLGACKGGDRAADKPGEQGPRSSGATSVEQVVKAAKPPAWATQDERGAQVWKDVVRFYEGRQHKLAWFEDDKPTEAARVFAAAAEDAGDHGLDPREYGMSEVKAWPEGGFLSGPDVDAEKVIGADVRTTWAFMRYASDMLRGRVDPSQVDKHWVGKRREADVAELAGGALDKDGMERALREMPPAQPQYHAMREALARYRGLAKDGGWPALPADFRVKKGGSSPLVVALRQRLAAEGDLAKERAVAAPAVQPASMNAAPAGTRPAPASPMEVYDQDVLSAVKAFEQRHGLAADGLLDAKTIEAMNVPVEEKVRLLQLNLERWRWMPNDPGERYLVVNIPMFELRGYDKENVTLAMSVVVGKTESPTPIFSDEMEAVVFSPYWNIPPSILKDETAPAIRKNASYLYENDLEVTRGGRVVDPWSVDWSNPDPGVSVRQRPGAKNALGRAKFIFPNSFDVYLHDTPAESYFSRTARAFSHGCVRVQDPRLLAEWVLKNESSWTPDRITTAMLSGQEKHVAVKPRIPVYLVYSTAWVASGGAVLFRPDLYGHDARQRQLLPGDGKPTPAGQVVAQKQASNGGKPAGV